MSGSSRWSDLKLRLTSAVILVVVAGGCLWQGGMIYNALILLAMFGLVWEGLPARLLFHQERGKASLFPSMSP